MTPYDNTISIELKYIELVNHIKIVPIPQSVFLGLVDNIYQNTILNNVTYERLDSRFGG